MTDTLINYLGIPVEGEITRGGRSETPQRPASELAPILMDALNAEGVEAVRWWQRTPYFNDGEPCYFSTWMDDECVQLEGFDDWQSPGDVRLSGGRDYNYVQVKDETTGRTRWDKQYTGEEFPKHPAADALNALCDAIGSGAFNDVLLDAFGDHAIVEVTKEGITVEFYEHD